LILEEIRRAEVKVDQIFVFLEDQFYDPSADIQSENLKIYSTPHHILVRAHEIVSRVETTRSLALNSEDTNNIPTFCRSVFCQYVNVKRWLDLA
jgi:hypothetical protein